MESPYGVPATGDDPSPGIRVSAPVAGLTAKPDRALDPEFSTYRNCPLGVNAIKDGPVPPLANGDPVTGVSIPVDTLIEYAETLPDPKFAT
jgi:hypothetical protein